MIAEYASQPSPFDDDDDDDEAFAFESTERVLESTPSLGERPVAGDDDADPLDEDACECYSQPPPPSDSVSDDRRGEEEEEEEEEEDEVLKERRSPRERGRMGTSHEEEGEGGRRRRTGEAGLGVGNLTEVGGFTSLLERRASGKLKSPSRARGTSPGEREAAEPPRPR